MVGKSGSTSSSHSFDAEQSRARAVVSGQTLTRSAPPLSSPPTPVHFPVRSSSIYSQMDRAARAAISRKRTANACLLTQKCTGGGAGAFPSKCAFPGLPGMQTYSETDPPPPSPVRKSLPRVHARPIRQGYVGRPGMPPKRPPGGAPGAPPAPRRPPGGATGRSPKFRSEGYG